MDDQSYVVVNDGVVFMLYSLTEVKGKVKSDELSVVKNGWDFSLIEWFRNGLSWISSCCQNSKFLVLQVAGTGYSWGGTGFPVQNLQTKPFFFVGTGSQYGGTGFPIQNSMSALF